MSEPKPDPTQALYELMDQAGLTASSLYNTRKPMAQIVNEIRTKLVTSTREYILAREGPAPPIPLRLVSDIRPNSNNNRRISNDR